VVHLWVEDFLELFTTVMAEYMFVLLGVVRERIALTVVFLDLEEPEDILFTEITQPVGVPAIGGDGATAARVT
jgi:hypothetical protein